MSTSLSKRIAQAMRAKGMKNADLARETGASTGTVANWLSGARRVGPTYAFELQRILGLDPKVLLRRPRRQASARKAAA